MPTRLTRRQLYELVWSQPMTKLAAQFGLSDVGLRKICHKHRVPTPPAGHWAKKAYGKRVTTKPLPDVAKEAEILIRESAASSEPNGIAEARVALTAAAASPSDTCAANPIVERTLLKLSKAHPGRDRLIRCEGVGFVRVAIRPESLQRAGHVLRQFVAAAEGAGLRLAKHEGGAAWLCDDETVQFELVEVTDQVPHVSTEEELSAVEKWKRDREETHRRYGYWRDWGEPRIPKWEHRYQGRLAIKLEEVRIQSDHSPWGDAIRRSFADSKTRDVTQIIPRIVGAIGASAAAKKTNRDFEVRRKAAAEKAARDYEELQRRRADEQKATAFLDELIAEHEAQLRVQSVAKALRAKGVSSGRSIQFMKWLDRRLTTIEARSCPAAFEERLAAAGLFEPRTDDGD